VLQDFEKDLAADVIWEIPDYGELIGKYFRWIEIQEIGTDEAIGVFREESAKV